jgi:predicted membrane metal-binding protein
MDPILNMMILCLSILFFFYYDPFLIGDSFIIYCFGGLAIIFYEIIFDFKCIVLLNDSDFFSDI